jgi:hypothetical protein
MIQISVRTLFDCTATGVVGHIKYDQLPFKDHAQQLVDSNQTWMRSRNQQRNWESLIQVISLRTQPYDVIDPEFNKANKCWEFTFAVEFESLYSDGTDDLAELKRDLDQVPMIVGLTETADLDGILKVAGADVNIWFEYNTNK